jgi:hypothetical protein
VLLAEPVYAESLRAAVDVHGPCGRRPRLSSNPDFVRNCQWFADQRRRASPIQPTPAKLFASAPAMHADRRRLLRAPRSTIVRLTPAMRAQRA